MPLVAATPPALLCATDPDFVQYDDNAHSLVEFGNDECAARAYLATLPSTTGVAPVATGLVAGPSDTPTVPRAVQELPPTPAPPSRAVSLTDAPLTVVPLSTQLGTRTGSAGAAARAAGTGQPRGPTALPPLPAGIIITGVPDTITTATAAAPVAPAVSTQLTQSSTAQSTHSMVQDGGVGVQSPARPRPPPTPMPAGGPHPRQVGW